MTKEEIVAASIPFCRKAKKGVYFLIRNEEVVYVGQSRKMKSRVTHHHNAEKIDFDAVFYLPVKGSEEERLRVEADYIREFRPLYNCVGNPDYVAARVNKKAKKRLPKRVLVQYIPPSLPNLPLIIGAVASKSSTPITGYVKRGNMIYFRIGTTSVRVKNLKNMPSSFFCGVGDKYWIIEGEFTKLVGKVNIVKRLAERPPLSILSSPY